MRYYIFLIILSILVSLPLFAQNPWLNNSQEYEITHLPPSINTKYDELAPFYIKKHDILLFTSNRKYNGGGHNQNLFVTKKMDFDWTEPSPLNSYINSKQDDGSFTSSSQYDIFYFARKIKRNTDIYSCEGFINDSNVYIFTEPKECTDLNSPDWDSEPCITKDGQRIYFASNRPGGFGGSDIWASDWDGEKWSKPYNLGEKVNTKYDEFSPFFYEEEKCLYFSSDRKGGYGKLDFYSALLNDSGWTFPLNLGQPINSNEDELFFFRMSDSAFFASNRDGKSYDIFLISPKLKKTEKPADVTVNVYYHVLNKITEKPVTDYFPRIDDVVSSKFISPSINSFYPEKFHFETTPNHLHKIRITSKGYLEFMEYFKPDSSIQSERIVYLLPLENTYILNVSFQKNESKLSPSSYPALDSAFDMLRHYPELTAEIAGHTDSDGNASLNEWVSQIRADVVKKYFVERGIPADRLTAKGYGSNEPLKSNDTEEGRQANRRVEIRTRIKTR
jgi:hypothetical protein